MNALNPGRLVRIQGCGLTGRVLGPEEEAGVGRYAVLVPVLGQSVTLPAHRLTPLSSLAGERLGRRAQRINREAQEYLERTGAVRIAPAAPLTAPLAAPLAALESGESGLDSIPLTLNAARNAQLAALAELVVPSSAQ